jgi:uncharacterized protein DUF4199
MRKIVITFGSIAGAIMICSTFLSGTLIENNVLPMSWAEVTGYASMLIALSMVFFGIKSYRDNYNNGSITFWKGVQTGVLISLIASVLYFAGGELYNAVNPNFFPKVMEKYVEMQADKMKANGSSDDEVVKMKEEMAGMMTLFKNPLIRFGIFVMEMFPIGIIVTLVSAGLLRRREILPA